MTYSVNYKLKPNFIGSYFGNYKRILLTDSFINIIENKNAKSRIPISELDILVLYSNKLTDSIKLQFKSRVKTLHYISKKDSKLFYEKLTILIANNIQTIISKSYKNFSQLAKEEFLRDSSIIVLDSIFSKIIKQYLSSEKLWNDVLDDEYITMLDEVKSYYPFSVGCISLREQFENKQLKKREAFLKSVESNHLTNDQALSVIRSNDKNLILAAAGTGKTSVIVAKTLDLIDTLKANPKEILILCYNKKAAQELKERYLLRAENLNFNSKSVPTISTFHGLGLGVLKKAEINANFSPLAKSEKAFNNWIHNWLVSYIKSSQQAMFNFIKLSFEPVNVFDFEKFIDYIDYTRKVEYYTLQNEKVKNYQELVIANWLYLNQID
ncbi:UvrD-helicase domain-containing protein [Allofrancisella guangzhouensis]|uniref:UvrD-helicase domain-containing protein n=1 Tax=Allofrancisella guangzhouensis TaxID=594679 RepID=UPI00190451DD|nr:UvrD-helicase domain-containing protein [Allofrancisella guangzhouensis]MBK2046045.1 UvrD-helicase domain-containing protein [Allofrancisella guangzhouensis]